MEKFGRTCGASATEHLDFVHLCCRARRAAAELQNERPMARSFSGLPSFALAMAALIFNRIRCTGRFTMFPGVWSLSGPRLRAAGCSTRGAISERAGDQGRRLGDDRSAMCGSTNATAAAVTLLRNLSMPINGSVGDWLLAQHHPQGGFVAAPGAPMPDLLSTATALHALAGLEVSFEALREDCLDFIDTLWTNQGAFWPLGRWIHRLRIRLLRVACLGARVCDC